MLRAATKKSVEHGLKGVRLQTTQAAPPPPMPPKKSGGGGSLALTVGALTAAAGGVVGYAYVDPEFRNKVETTAPFLKPLFEKVLGAASLPKTKQQISDLKDQVVASIPKKKEEILPPLIRPAPPAIDKKAAVHVDAVDVKKTIDILPPKPTAEQTVANNKQLESSLLAALRAAESRVRDATEAKIQTIAAVNQHAQLLKKTVDNGANADWEKVTSALQHAESLSRSDGSAEADGRNFIDNLRKVIAEGKSSSSTSSNPLLINAAETANKLSHQLDELNGLVNKARQESTILNQYKDLIDRSRQQFAMEMKSILPNVDVHAKNKTLNEDELNALIAHAHLKVDQLRRQLSEQQVREEQMIARALKDQRSADERIARDQLNVELNRVRQEQEIQVERAVMSSRNSWESELEEQLQRTSAAHSEHLEQVIRTQRQLFDIEHNQKVEEAVLLERDHHSRAVGAALSRLEGIEHALGSRVILDAENRKAKQFWIACHSLIDSIKHGKKGGNDMEERRLPLGDSLSMLQQVNPDDEFVNTLVSTFPSQSMDRGLYTEQDLKNRFDTVYKLGRRTACIDVNGSSLTGYLWSFARSLFLFDLPRKLGETDQIDPVSIDNIEVLSRAKWMVERGDLEGAARLLQLLRGEPAQLATDWVVDTRAHLEARLLAQLLVAHAAVSSIRSTY